MQAIGEDTVSEYTDNYMTDDDGQRWVKKEYAQTYADRFDESEAKIAALNHTIGELIAVVVRLGDDVKRIRGNCLITTEARFHVIRTSIIYDLNQAEIDARDELNRLGYDSEEPAKGAE